MPDSRIENQLKVLAGESYPTDPQSNVEEIIQAIIDKTEYTKAPDSRIEAQLIEILNNGGGGGGDTPSVEEKQINFIDYDGTILYSYDLEEAATITSLPPNPTHSGLISKGWNWSFENIVSYIYANPKSKIWVGQMYNTNDDKTRLYCTFNKYCLTPRLTINLLGTIRVDWGDGSQTEDFTYDVGNNTYGQVLPEHVYASPGDYVITLELLNGSGYFFNGTSTTTYLIYPGGDSTIIGASIYLSAIKKIELSSNVKLEKGSYPFSGLINLKSIIIPPQIQNLPQGCFYNCLSLKGFVLPKNDYSTPPMLSYAFGYCYNILYVSLPVDIYKGVEPNVFAYCYSLRSITIPSSGNYIGQNAFIGCKSIQSIVIPANISGYLGNNAFSDNYSVSEYHFMSNTPPKLNSNALKGISPITKIYVPYSNDHSILEAYQNDTSWSSYKSKIFEEPINN